MSGSRVTLITTELDDAGNPIGGLGGTSVVEIQTGHCPQTCTGYVTRVIKDFRVHWLPCTNGCWP